MVHGSTPSPESDTVVNTEEKQNQVSQEGDHVEEPTIVEDMYGPPKVDAWQGR